MEIMYFLIPIATLLVLSFVLFFIWAAKSGQFDDLDSPSKRILFEDIKINKEEAKKEESYE